MHGVEHRCFGWELVQQLREDGKRLLRLATNTREPIWLISLCQAFKHVGIAS